jgi:hypothetical protein
MELILGKGRGTTQEIAACYGEGFIHRGEQG